MRTKRGTAGALALAAALVAAPPAPAGAVAGPAAAEGEVSAGRTVTLITGDRVTVMDGGGAVIKAGAGRDDITFTTSESGGRLRIVPSDARPLLRAGRLDPRLFDVTGLLESGYDDRRGSVPLIVTGAGQPRTMAAAGAVTPLTAVGGYAVEARPDAFWQDLTRRRSLTPGSKIWLDGRRKVSLDVSVPQIGAPAAWAKGHTGAGVKVAVLDTGIDATHPDLAGKVVARKDFTEAPDERDLVGHGTHVASTIAGSGAASGGRYRGVAPDAELLDGRVCEEIYCTDSAILAGMQWAAEQGAKVVNMSLGTADTPEEDPLEQAVRTLSEQYGTLFVAAAGNAGQERAVSSPASAGAALAVGAVNASDEPAPFSSRGPGPAGEVKPDITAPGVEITAARGKDSPGSGPYVTKSGTSMATPHVAGAAAILAGQHPDWTGGLLKAALMASAEPAAGTGVFTQGAGRVNVDRATAQSVTAEPATLGFGRQAWPHDDDRPVARKLVYRNPSAASVTLTLESQAGAAFSVSPATLTVPAGGQAEATVTADTRADVPDGLLGGYVVATAPGGVHVSTPVGVEKEVESYELTVRHTDRSGAATGDFEMSIARLDAETQPIIVFGGESTYRARLPKGRWSVDTVVLDETGLTLLVQPEVILDRDRTIEADARLGRPLLVRPPADGATPSLAQVVYQWREPGGGFARSWLGRSFDRLFTVQLGPDRADDRLLSMVTGQWTAGTSDYRLAWFEPGRLPTGFERSVNPENLAVVRRDYAAHLPDATAETTSQAWPRRGSIPSSLATVPTELPSTRTEYVNTDDGIRWQHHLFEYGSDGRLNRFESGFTHYPAGRTTTERWNRGVFGPHSRPATSPATASAGPATSSRPTSTCSATAAAPSASPPAPPNTSPSTATASRWPSRRP
ncbi:peptidase S8 and S53, subtilisin, kexin, sedolisin [[Actinomadura] parvosata subsp. kistnae]|nr:peptidase S8 and S53, subtilisin, kexin, sedolisin [Actinomadura parvosata subsp. kistnae]